MIKMNKLKKAECTECGKIVTSIKEMVDHYKEHPEITVIDGVNEAEAMEQLIENEKE